MRLGIFSDVHGNLPALESCLEKLRSLNVDRLVCLGDVFGYFPQGTECLGLLTEARAVLLLGNHEAMLMGRLPLEPERDAVYGLEAQRPQLSERQKEMLMSLSPVHSEVLDGRRLLFVHGTAEDPLQGRLYPDQQAPDWESSGYDAVFMGHTHRLHAWRSGRTVAVNVGSCGLPRDKGALGTFGVYDTVSGDYELYRFELDVAEMLNRYVNVHDSVRENFKRDDRVSIPWSMV
ncbi:metallophosphoesterase family protein [Salidesulfovibrio onnuriiensis]|uniref:metallophosphoesterase family protein n=1 Tax=Salidesulfovibrio onnuriiensis TaxID=2583823 RepID=UPI0011C7F2E8|nr:metallophosphoesterase family protein [Salidesulfovibrio onnuriiensis]